MTEPTESLITDAHRAAIGQRGDPVKVVIREADARRMRDLLHDTDPRYADGTGLAPPYVLSGLAGGRPGGSVPQILPNGILTQTEWQFFLIYGAGRAVAAGLISVAATVTVSKWFIRKRGLAVGLTTVGTRAGFATMPIFIELMSDAFDWRVAAYALAGTVAFFGTVGFAAVGTLFAAMTAQLRAREVLLPVFLLPLVVPVLLAAVRLTEAALAGDPWSEAAASSAAARARCRDWKKAAKPAVTGWITR